MTSNLTLGPYVRYVPQTSPTSWSKGRLPMFVAAITYSRWLCAYVIAGGYAYAYVILIAGGCVSAYVVASGCVNSLLKTYSVILLPSLQPSTIFLHHVKSKIHWDYYINMNYYQISMHFTVQIVKLATSAEIKVLISWILDIQFSFKYGWWLLVFFPV